MSRRQPQGASRTPDRVEEVPARRTTAKTPLQRSSDATCAKKTGTALTNDPDPGRADEPRQSFVVRERPSARQGDERGSRRNRGAIELLDGGNGRRGTGLAGLMTGPRRSHATRSGSVRRAREAGRRRQDATGELALGQVLADRALIRCDRRPLDGPNRDRTVLLRPRVDADGAVVAIQYRVKAATEKRTRRVQCEQAADQG